MIRCPGCHRSIGGASSEGGLKVRIGIVLVDPETGRVHGPCQRCGADVVVVTGGTMADDMADIQDASPGLVARAGRLG